LRLLLQTGNGRRESSTLIEFSHAWIGWGPGSRAISRRAGARSAAALMRPQGVHNLAHPGHRPASLMPRWSTIKLRRLSSGVAHAADGRSLACGRRAAHPPLPTACTCSEALRRPRQGRAGGSGERPASNLSFRGKVTPRIDLQNLAGAQGLRPSSP